MGSAWTLTPSAGRGTTTEPPCDVFHICLYKKLKRAENNIQLENDCENAERMLRAEGQLKFAQEAETEQNASQTLKVAKN